MAKPARPYRPPKLAEEVEFLGEPEGFAQQLVDRHLLGLVGPSECLARADVLAYERRRQERLAAVADVTAADVASGVPYR